MAMETPAAAASNYLRAKKDAKKEKMGRLLEIV
jgi:hypothetical protein